MQQPPVGFVPQSRTGDGAVGVPGDLAERMSAHVLEAQTDELAPRDGTAHARAAVVDDEVARLLRPRAPRRRNHQVDDAVHRHQVGHLLRMAQHRAEETLSCGGDDARRAVPVVHPTLERAVHAAQHYAGPHDDQRQVTLVLFQPTLGQRFGEGVRVRSVADQLPRQRIDQVLVQRVDEVRDLIGAYRRRIDRLLHLCPVTVTVRRRHVHQRLQMRHLLAQLHQSLRAQHVDGDGQLQLLVEFDGGRAVEHDVDGPSQHFPVVRTDCQLLLCDVALDRVHLLQVVRPLFPQRVEQLQATRKQSVIE